MPPRHESRATHTLAALYRSSSCLIGTHGQCAHSAPVEAPDGIPVIYEACSCSCHMTAAGRDGRTEAPQ